MQEQVALQHAAIQSEHLRSLHEVSLQEVYQGCEIAIHILRQDMLHSKLFDNDQRQLIYIPVFDTSNIYHEILWHVLNHNDIV